MNEVLKALGDPNRREILRLLRGGDRKAGDIAGQFDISWPSISYHLNVLKQAGLIRVERQGQELIYSLNTTVIQEFLAEFIAWLGEAGDEV